MRFVMTEMKEIKAMTIKTRGKLRNGNLTNRHVSCSCDCLHVIGHSTLDINSLAYMGFMAQ